MAPNKRPASETSQTLADRAQGAPEQAALGKNPKGSMLRVVLFAVLFIVIAGSLFYWFAR